MDFIIQMEPSYDHNEKNALNEYMESGGWLMEFKKTRELESMIADYTGAKYCSIMPNGTVSLSVALIACGIGVGDEVIVPDYTMVATPNAVELIGAKAVFFVSINGRCPKDIDKYVEFCKSCGIHFLEDAAQSLGSFCNGKHLGRFGEIGSFSFSVPKIITTGQGGALITDDEELYNKIVKIRDFGRDKGGSDHYLTKGWNFKFTDVQAVIGIEQMKKLHSRVIRKKEMGELYGKLLSGIAGVELIPTDLEETSPWFYDILADDREKLLEFLKDNGIGSRIFYPPLHAEPAYGYEGNYPVTEEIAKKGLWLPSAITLTDEQITYICGKIREFYS